MQSNFSLLSAKTLLALERLKVSLRRSYLGSKQGAHISPRKGHGLEFADFRDYEPGDNPRAIDWGLYGRTDKLYIKRFHEEENVQVVIILDMSSSMTCDISFFKDALKLGEALSFSALMNNEKVLFNLLGLNETIAINSHSDLLKLRRYLNELIYNSTRYNTTSTEIFNNAKNPGICFIISDFLFPEADTRKLSHTIKKKNLDGVFIQLLHNIPEDIDATWIDSETKKELPISTLEEARDVYKQRTEALLNSNRAAVTESGFLFIEKVLPYKSEEEILQIVRQTGLFS